MWHDRGWTTWDWTGMGLMMLLFWGGLVALGVWLARVGTNGQSTPPPQSPEEVLAQRFARGEINEDEYIRRRELLHNTANTS